MHPEKIQLDQIKNGRLSAIIYFDISQKKKVNYIQKCKFISYIFCLTWLIWNK